MAIRINSPLLHFYFRNSTRFVTFLCSSHFRLQVADIDQTILVTNHLRHTPSLLRHTPSPLRHTPSPLRHTQSRHRHTVPRHITKVRKAEAAAEDSLKMTTKWILTTSKLKTKASFQNFSKHTNSFAITRSYSRRRVGRSFLN